MEPFDIKIFTRKDAPRLNYIAGIIMGDILGLHWEYVTDKRKLGKHPVINYSSENIPDSFRIEPDSLLFETDITKQEIVTGNWKNLPVFFLTPDDSDLPFDIFAASFYMVSRYEEYLDIQRDEHGRFPASLSLACKNEFNDIPVVDLWAKEFAKTLLKKFPTLAYRRNEYKALLTVDIDVPFAYMGRSILRSVGGVLRDLVHKNENITDRYHVIANDKKDPYETFDYIIEKAQETQTETRFFFSVGEHSEFDKNPSWKNTRYRELIKLITSKYTPGLHPSYYAAENYSLLEKELAHLSKVTAKDIVSSRFHYLRLFIPVSYRRLLNAGIPEDFSMGWHDEPGFRAGIARPYFFYDILEDKQTTLTIVPFQVMDVTLYQYKGFDPVKAKEVISKLINNTKKVGGLFVSIWHNTSLLETSEWQEWRNVFEAMLHDQQPLSAL